ncbi:MipA/OmpV family protein [Marinomonas rhizomae]|uniref:MipA/OmpV family protein n=1 Tax=Marinomonas rhizomae TaxID=491948 RepID=UPI002104C747|nr:MipA/OmpV family protein [Marinomonas rhizomae]UTW00953.1 MipA/OmpV family protein [Marinomonas rhizomae]
MKNKAKTKEKHTKSIIYARLKRNRLFFKYSLASFALTLLTTGEALADGTTSVALGIAAGVSGSEYREVDSDLAAIPIVLVDNSWIYLLGSTLDLKVAETNSIAFTIRGKYGLGDGYDSSDSYIFDGMDSRDSSLWVGPAMTWSNPMFDLKLEALVDAMNNSDGQQASFSISKGFSISERLQVEPSIGTTWYSDKYVNYYYGVKSSEVNANRSQYDGKSTTVLDAGVRFNYAIDKQQSLALDVSVKQFGDEVEDSPLTDKKTTAAAYLGYIYRFK